MIGAIIGDLAAWTYENDRDTFWKQLVSNNSKDIELSVYGHAYFRAASRNVWSVPEQDVAYINTSQLWSPENHLRQSGQWLMWQLMCAWNDDLPAPKDIPGSSFVDKEEGYARMFVIELIRLLRHGHTKSEAYHSVYSFEQLSKSWHWKAWSSSSQVDSYSILTCIFRAWDSFYRGFDFTSSLHNAMKWDGDRHLIAMLTASFASAMYGCHFSFIKKKFAIKDEISHVFDIHQLKKHIGYNEELWHRMIDHANIYRDFYPKNCALTNVERHRWSNVSNMFDQIMFSEDEYKRILRCSPTSWDNRYGIYLDDGWLYVYRSNWLIGRFQLCKADECWRITNTQLSGERPWRDFCLALFCALTESCNLYVSPNQYQSSSSLCKYYQGELSCPKEWENDIKGKFWHGEMMFCTNHINMDVWAEQAQEVIKKLKGKKLKFAKSMPLHQFGLVLYIETLFSKWCPYDDLSWIYEY